MKRSLILILFVLNYFIIHGNPNNRFLADSSSRITLLNQDILNSPSVIPSSPHSQIFEQYINHSADEFNGLSEIEIPLYEVNINGLNIPIKLSYHSGGVKYQQNDGDVGVGWSISAGGFRVSRSIFGLPDERYPLYDHEDIEKILLNSDSNPSKRDNYLGSIDYSLGLTRFPGECPQNIVDGGYDQFVYMLPSSNGHFIIKNRETMETDIIEHNPDIIKLNEVEKNPFFLRDISIIDNSGFIYKLGGNPDGKTSYLNEYYGGNNDTAGYSIGWPLRKIISPYNQAIDFKYQRFQYCPRLREHTFASMPVNDARTTIGLETFVPIEYFMSGENISKGQSRINAIEKHISSYSQLLIEEINSPNETVKFIRKKEDINQPHLLGEIQVYNKFDKLNISIRFNYLMSTESNWHTLLQSIEITDGNSCKKKFDFEYYDPPAKNCWYTYPDQWGYYKPKDNHYGIESVTYDFPLNKLNLHREFLDYKLQYESEVNQFPELKGWFKPIRDIVYSSEYHCFQDRSENKNPHYFSLKKITFPTGGTSEYEYEPNQYNYAEKSVIGCGQRIKRIKSDAGNYTPSLITEFKYGENENGLGYCPVHLQPQFFIKDNFDINYRVYPSDFLPSLYFVSATREYLMQPFCSELSNLTTTYKTVSKYTIDPNNVFNNGKVLSEYQHDHLFRLNYMSPVQINCNRLLCRVSACLADKYNQILDKNLTRLNVSDYFLFSKPVLVNRKLFNEKNTLINEKILEYKELEKKEYKGIKLNKVVSVHNTLSHSFIDYCFGFFNSTLSYMFYKIHFGDKLLSRELEYQYTSSGKIENVKEYVYDKGKKITEITNKDSQGNMYKTNFKYPESCQDPIYRKMTDANMVSSKIEEITRCNDKITKAVRFNYQKNEQTNNLFLPVSAEISFNGLDYQQEITYDSYSSIGNITQYTTNESISTSILWGFAEKYPVAEVVNATIFQVQNALIFNSLKPLGPPGKPGYGSEYTPSQLEKLRKNDILKNSLITTFTYHPIFGMTSRTNPRGQTTYYYYDDLGELKEVYVIVNGNKELLKSYYYHLNNR